MKKVLIFWLVLAVLFAQGLRLCLHALDAASPSHAHSTAVHVESQFNSDQDTDETSRNGHLAIAFMLLKQIGGDSLAAVLVAVVVVLFLFRPSISVYWAVPFVPPSSRGYRWRPPLRAPPR